MPRSFNTCNPLRRFQFKLSTSRILKPPHTQYSFAFIIITPQASKFLAVRSLDGVNFEHYNDGVGRIDFKLLHFVVEGFEIWFLRPAELKIEEWKLPVIEHSTELLAKIGVRFG